MTKEYMKIKWGFMRGQPCFDEFEKDLNEYVKSNINSISDEMIEEMIKIPNHYKTEPRSAQLDYKIGFRMGIKTILEQLLKTIEQ